MEDLLIVKAEHQLIGFIHAKSGYDLESLLSSMGLTQGEWIIIKKDGGFIPDDIKKQIDDYFKIILKVSG